MNLNSEDIYSNIESFRNKHGYTLEKMAEIIGMSDKSAYSGMIKNRRLKFKYFINLLNNTDLTADQLLFSSTKYQQANTKVDKVQDEEIKVRSFSCPDCIEKDKETELWKSKFYALCDESREVERKYRELLEAKIEVKKETQPESGAQAV